MKLEFETDAFSDGQIKSKLWLCEKIELLIKDNTISLLGGWYGVTAMLLFSRNNCNIKLIHSVDIDPVCEQMARKINNVWEIEGRFITSTCDVNHWIPDTDVYVNTSCEHMKNDWYDLIPSGKLVAIQGCDMDHEQHTHKMDMQYMINSFDMDIVDYGELSFTYPDKSFKRYMLIGYKK